MFQIREARKRAGITQKMLAIRLGIAQTTVSGWENDSKMPSVETLMRIADILGVTTDYLLGRTQIPLAVIDTPESVSAFEKQLLEAYKKSSVALQGAVCDILHIQHPASERAKVSRA